MSAVMTLCSLLALASYLLIARPAERRVSQVSVMPAPGENIPQV
jgi:hypothetical protein